jgi:excisionase family DNA binding protein
LAYFALSCCGAGDLEGEEIVSTTAKSGLAEQELMLSPAEIAERVGVSIDAVRRAIRAGDLPAAKIFGRVRVHQRDLDRYIDEHVIAPASTVRDLIDVGRRMPAPHRGSLRAHL